MAALLQKPCNLWKNSVNPEVTSKLTLKAITLKRLVI